MPFSQKIPDQDRLQRAKLRLSYLVSLDEIIVLGSSKIALGSVFEKSNKPGFRTRVPECESGNEALVPPIGKGPTRNW